MTTTVVVQKWEESEAGWGQRPDGCSLHLSEEDRAAYVKAYWDRMPSSAPSEYSRPDGTPYLWDADEETYEQVKASKNGVRRYDLKRPGSGGTDGWVAYKPKDKT